MEWLLDPTIWVGLVTLVVLEIVLGIDNLIFIAILADKLPPRQRDRARVIGLSLALAMRVGLLGTLSLLFALTQPWLWIGSWSFSGRDVILVLGGFFLVLKGTMELHERMEGPRSGPGMTATHAGFWIIVTQIVVLDAVFSLDAVITAIGMVERLEVMIAAVTIAMLIMLVASKPLTRFVSAHPTVVVLCLGFLLMIGFALIAEGFGFTIPKGYLYAAIAFSIGIETLNQIARHNLRKLEAGRPLRERTADAILRMLGKSPATPSTTTAAPATAPDEEGLPFGIEERNMVSGILHLADRSIHSIMTPRADIEWINLEQDADTLLEQIRTSPHAEFPVCRGDLDHIVGIGRAQDVIADLLHDKKIRESRLREPILIHETIRTLDLLETLKAARGQLVLVLDEFGTIEGLVTPMNLFEAIAGDFPGEDEAPDIIQDAEHRWVVDGATDLLHLEQTLDIEGLSDNLDEFSTLAGLLLQKLDRLPETGDEISLQNHQSNWYFRILELDGRRIAKVLIERLPGTDDADVDQAVAAA